MRYRNLIRALGLLAITMICVPASAHTVLVSANPAENSIIQSLPSTISITFAEELIDIGDSNSISVTDESGTELTSLTPLVEGAVLTAELKQTELTGKFKVSYRAVAADGHVITGNYVFAVSPEVMAETGVNSQEVKTAATSSENKISIYLIISAPLIAGGGLVLFFIWKRQSK